MNYRQSVNLDQIIPSLAKFHAEFQTAGLKKNGKNDHLKNKYVTLDNILNTIRPILSNNGLVIVQALAGEYLVTSLYHISGQFIQSEMPFSPMSGNRGTNSLQELGGGITYARRYALSALLSLSVDADDDGAGSNIKKEELQKKPKKQAVNSDDQLQKLVEWVNKNPSRIGDLENYYELSADQMQFIKDNLIQ